jgi:hypothetical protein
MKKINLIFIAIIYLLSINLNGFSQETENEEIDKLKYEIARLKQENLQFKKQWKLDVELVFQKMEKIEKGYSETDTKLVSSVEEAVETQKQSEEITNERFLKYRKYIKYGFFATVIALLIGGLCFVYLLFFIKRKNNLMQKQIEEEKERWSLTLSETERKLQKSIQENRNILTADLKKHSTESAESLKEIKQSMVENEKQLQEKTAAGLASAKQERENIEEGLQKALKQSDETNTAIPQKLDALKKEILQETGENKKAVEKEMQKIKTELSADIKKLQKK